MPPGISPLECRRGVEVGPALALVTVTADRFGILGGASHQALDLRGIGIASEITSCQSAMRATVPAAFFFAACGRRPRFTPSRHHARWRRSSLLE